MKRVSIAIVVVVAVGALFVCTASAQEECPPFAGERWDLRMIDEATIWSGLLVNYYYAEPLEYWPERRSALEEIVEKFPDSSWADDAALVLACGRACFEDDVFGAIEGLERVIDQYPISHTVIEEWNPEFGCLLDDTWLMWVGGLVFLDEEGLVRSANPFDAYGEIAHRDQEALTYFNHLEICPRSTKVTARLLIAELLGQIGDWGGAVARLEEIVENSMAYIGIVSTADRSAAARADGFLIRGLDGRPEYRAFRTLIDSYEILGEIDRAGEVAHRFLAECSPNGWLWAMHRHIGDFFSRNDMAGEAEEQYWLALEGLEVFQAEVERRREYVDGSELPEDFFDLEREELYERLRG